MYACGIGEVEFIKENQSEKHFFDESFGHFMESWCTFFENVSQNVHNERNCNDPQDHQKHSITVSYEICIVIDSVDARRSKSLQQA